MSSRRWNLLKERKTERMLESCLLNAIAIGTAVTMASSSSSYPVDVLDMFSIDELEMLFALDRAESDQWQEIVCLLASQLLSYHMEINSPVVDTQIAFIPRAAPKPIIADLSEAQCINEFRFRKKNLQDMADQLWPRMECLFELGGTKDCLVLVNRYTAPFETCLCMYLFRLHRPVRLRPDMEKLFRLKKSHISAALQTFSTALYELAQKYLKEPKIWHSRMPYYAEKVHQKSGLLSNIWGFIDATHRRICRPIRYQSQVYSGYKKCHSLKFQSVVTPDGYVALMHGPFVGRRHDARILHESGLLPRLQQLMPLDESNGRVYSLYGDSAYGISTWVRKGFVDPPPNSPQAAFNAKMSAVRVSVEWGFQSIISQWAFLDFRASMRIFKMPVGQYYINAAFINNMRICFGGSQTESHFDCPSMALHQYLSLIDDIETSPLMHSDEHNAMEDDT